MQLKRRRELMSLAGWTCSAVKQSGVVASRRQENARSRTALRFVRASSGPDLAQVFSGARWARGRAAPSYVCRTVQAAVALHEI